MRILLTNNTLGQRAGSELYLRDVAVALMKRGHMPVAYSTHLGAVAEELRRATVPVIDDLNALAVAPDIIHGQHHLDAMTAMLHFPDTPAIYMCHGWLPPEERAPLFPTIGRYVAVDDLCRERLLTTAGIPASMVEVLYNFADLDRFQPRPPLPTKPGSALVFSNYAADSATLAEIRAACLEMGITRFDIVGSSHGTAVDRPETILGSYDIVFAKARAAIEALTTGCAVVVADYTGLGGMVTSANLDALRRLNFGVRSLQKTPISQDAVRAELALYSPEDAQRVSAAMRQSADMQGAVTRLEAIYAEVMAAHSPAPADAKLKAAAAYMKTLAPAVKARAHAEAIAKHAEAAYAALLEQNAKQAAPEAIPPAPSAPPQGWFARIWNRCTGSKS